MCVCVCVCVCECVYVCVCVCVCVRESVCGSRIENRVWRIMNRISRIENHISRIENRISRIEDQGSRIKDLVSIPNFVHLGFLYNIDPDMPTLTALCALCLRLTHTGLISGSHT